jgi:hypothetical protein
MTGTIDLSIEQFNTIARSISETDSDVVRLVISPTTDLGGSVKPVVVKQYSLAYGDVLRLRYAVLRDGTRVPAPDETSVEVA